MTKYLPRLIESDIKKQMKATGCLVIEGPKWCGKSTTAKHFAKTVIELQEPAIYRKYKLLADVGDPLLLKGKKPLMFDEWQKVPDLWDYIRTDIDRDGKKGAYILTGSAKPLEDEERHSGTGRIVKLAMRPMSLWESGDSTGEVSLEELFNGNQAISGRNDFNLTKTAYLICRGGWPESVLAEDEETALLLARNYFKSLVETDITNVDEIKRNPERAKKILHAYARQISTLATNKTIRDDAAATDDTLDEKTLTSYANALRKLFVIDDVLPWSPALRSKTIMRTSNKRQFADPSIAAVALGAAPSDLINDIKTFGFLFESLCIRDLRVYAEKLGATVYYYNDNRGLEADAIIHLGNGEWGAIEIKLGGSQIDMAAENLKKLKAKIDTDKIKEPKFLMVLTGLDYAYRRPDGVLVVPIGCLKD